MTVWLRGQKYHFYDDPDCMIWVKPALLPRCCVHGQHALTMIISAWWLRTSSRVGKQDSKNSTATLDRWKLLSRCGIADSSKHEVVIQTKSASHPTVAFDVIPVTRENMQLQQKYKLMPKMARFLHCFVFRPKRCSGYSQLDFPVHASLLLGNGLGGLICER